MPEITNEYLDRMQNELNEYFSFVSYRMMEHAEQMRNPNLTMSERSDLLRVMSELNTNVTRRSRGQEAIDGFRLQLQQRGNNVEPFTILSTSERSIKRIKVPKMRLKKHPIKHAKECKTECPICYETHELHEVVTLGCDHRFCESCMVSHMNASRRNCKDDKYACCPMCRSDIKTFEVNYTTRIGKKNEVSKQSMYTKLNAFCC